MWYICHCYCIVEFRYVINDVMCYVMLCNTIAMLCSVVIYCLVLCYTLCWLLCCVVFAMLYYAVLGCALLCCVVFCVIPSFEACAGQYYQVEVADCLNTATAELFSFGCDTKHNSIASYTSHDERERERDVLWYRHLWYTHNTLTPEDIWRLKLYGGVLLTNSPCRLRR
jgi:hypothetical protein